MDNKKTNYIVTLPGASKSETWDSDKFERNREKLYEKYPDVSVQETSIYDNDTEDIAEGDSFEVTLPGARRSEVWDSAKFSRNREKLYGKYPDVSVSRIRAYNPQAPAQAQPQTQGQAPALPEQPDDGYQPTEYDNIMAEISAFDQDNAAFMSEYEAATDKTYLADNKKRYEDLASQRKAIHDKIYGTQEYRDYLNDRSASIDQMIKDVASQRIADMGKVVERKDMGFWERLGANNPYPQVSEDDKNYEAAQRLLADANKILKAPTKQDDTGIVKGFLRGAADTVSDVDFWNFGLSEIQDNMQIRSALEKVQDKLGSVDNLQEKDIENILSSSEKALVQAFAANAIAQSERAENLGRAYQSGMSFAESIPFMAEFALTGGVGKAASAGAKKAMTSWLTKRLGTMAEGFAKKATKAAGKAAIGAVDTGIRTVVQSALSPSTMRNVSEQLTNITDEGKLMDANKAFVDGAVDNIIEINSEMMGSAVSKVIAAPFKALMPSFAKKAASGVVKSIGNAPWYKAMKAGGWNGLPEEMLEEWYGNSLRALTGNTDALKDFATVDQQLVTLGAFIPMTAIGSSVSTAQYMAANKRMKNAAAALKTVLMDNGYTEEQANYLADYTRMQTPQQMSDNLTPIINQLSLENNDKAASDITKAAFRYMEAVQRYQTYDGIYQEQEGEQRQAMQTEIQDALGGAQFWQDVPLKDGSSKREVTMAASADGDMVYVVSQPDANGQVAVIHGDGRKGFANVSDLTDSATQDMDTYLSSAILTRRDEEDAARMETERQQQIADIQASATVGSQMNLGTQEAPVMAQILQTSPDGVIVQPEDGSAPRQLSWDEYGQMTGMQPVVRSQAAIDNDDADTIVAEQEARIAEQDGIVMPEAQEDNAVVPEQGTTDSVEEVRAEQDNLLRNPSGYILPVREDGKVNATALWNDNPAEWAVYNDRRIAEKFGQPDGGAASRQYITNAISTLDKSLKQLEKKRNTVTDFDEMESIEDQMIATTRRIQALNDVLASYVPQQDTAVAEQTVGSAQRQEQARQTIQQAEAGFPSIQARWNNARKIEGAEDQIILPDGTAISGRYVLTDAFAPTASHNPEAGFAMSEGFPVDEKGKTVNDRDYQNDKAAQDIVMQRASDYDSRALQSPVIVSNDGVVLSGNDRTMSSQVAARQGTDKKYTDYLSRYSQKYGFTPEQVAQFSNPRVVFVPSENLPYDTATFAKFNQRETKGQDKTEAAVKAGKVTSEETMAKIAGIIDGFDTISEVYRDSDATRQILDLLVQNGAITANDVPALMSGDQLSGAGEDLIESILVGNVLEEEALRVAMSDRAIRRAILSAIGPIITNRSIPGYNLTTELTDAVILLGRAKREYGLKQGENIAEYMRQQNLFGDNPVAEATVQILADSLNKKESSTLRKVLSYLNDEGGLAASGQLDIFSGETRTKEDIITEILNNLGYETRTAETAAEPAAEQTDTSLQGIPEGDTAEQVVQDIQQEETAEDARIQIEEESAKVDVNPTEGQKEAGNYRKGHITLDGRKVTIENPKGSIRRGVDRNGNAWETEMKSTYGYFLGTQGKDGDHIDVFIGESLESPEVFVVDQVDPETGAFDEHKVMYGFNSIEEARQAYLSNYEEGWKGLGNITGIGKDDFYKWLDSSKRKGKPFVEYSSVMKSAVEGQSGTQIQEQAGPVDVIEQAKDMSYGASNKIVSKDRYEELKKRMKAKLGQLNIGFDPETFAIGAEMAAYHLEAGARKFADFAARMVADLGNAVIPYLKSFYDGARRFPGMEEYAKEMDSADFVTEYDVDKLFSSEEKPVVEAQEEAPAEISATLGTVTEDKDTRDNSDLYVVKPSERTDDAGFRSLKQKAKANNGYYSRFKKGFIFRTREDADNFNRIESIQEPIQETVQESASENVSEPVAEQRTETPAEIKRPEKITESNGYKIGDAVIYKGKPAKITDFEYDGRPVLDVGLAPVMYEIVSFEDITKAEDQSLVPENIFEPKKIENEQTDEQTAADTASIGEQADALTSEAEAVAESAGSTEEQVNEVSDRIDDTLEQVNKQLALLGYYEADQDDSQFNESFGYMKTAEKKAVKDIDRLAKQLARDLGIKVGRKVLAQANIAPAGGDIYFRLPLSEGNELYVVVHLNPDRMDNLNIEKGWPGGIMYRIENTSGDRTEGVRYGSNMFADSDVTYDEFLRKVRNLVKRLIPEQVTDVIDTAVKIARKNRKSKEKEVDSPMLGGLFSELDNINTQKNGNDSGTQTETSAGAEDMGADATGTDAGIQAEGTEAASAGEQTGRKPDGDGTGTSGIQATADDGGVPSVGSERSGKAKPSGRVSAARKVKTANEKDNPLNTRNYIYPENSSEIDSLTPSKRFEANVNALETLVKLMEEGRQATEEEKDILARFRGWGGIDEAKYAYSTSQLKYSNSQYAQRLGAVLDRLDPNGEKNLLSAIRESALTSYYTPTDIARAINGFISKAGYRSGSILDPSMGSGIFEGTIQKDIQQHSAISGIEFDWITGNIAKYLYPDANIKIDGYQNSNMPKDAFDVVMSNIPFGSYGVNDKSWNRDSSPVKKAAQRKIHNYFVVKMLENTKPGGLCVIMTSNAVMDTKSNQIIREHIADEAEILGAIRLPDNTFKGAGTSVVTDLIFLRKYRNTEDKQNTTMDQQYSEKILSPFLSSQEMKLSNKNGETYDVPVNAYFSANPDMMIGSPVAGGQYSADAFGLTSDMTTPQIAETIEGLIDRQIIRGRSGLFDTHNSTAAVVQAVRESYTGNGDFVGSGNIVEQDGKIGILTASKNSYGETESLFEEIKGLDKKKDRIRSYMSLRTALKQLISEEISGADDNRLSELRKALKNAYDSFVKKYGKLVEKENDFIDSDIDGFTVRGLEKYDGGKFVGLSDIFTKKTIKATLDLSNIKTPHEAIAVSLSEYGDINPSFMEKILGEDWPSQCGDALFLVPFTDGRYETKDKYLSGDVKSKLEDARIAAQSDSRFNANVSALEAVQPAKIPIEDISIRMGARWVPDSIYTDFLVETLGIFAYDTRKTGVKYVSELDSFVVDVQADRLGGKAKQWETGRKSAKEIFIAALEDKTIFVYDTLRDGTKVLNREQTDLANEKVADLRTEFEDWISQDAKRVNELETIYNDKFNRVVLRKYDGSHLNIAGLQGKELRPHQKDAVWMLINNRGGIIDHIVGAGKTLVMQSAIMEMRRMGIAKKPMIIALKSTVAQIAKEFREAFPSARVLAPTEKDFATVNRKKFLSNIAVNDYDCIILSHEQYTQLPHTEEIERQSIDEQMEQIENAIEYLYGTGDRSQLTKKQIKGLESRKKNLEAKLEKLLDRKTDREFTFEALGVDYLFVDECQQFKSLPYVTSYNNVAGLADPKGSQRAIALLNGVRYLQKLHQGDRGSIFLSGTTITNSLVEIYNLFQYLRPNEMARLGFNTFDAWASNFALRSSELEYGVTNELKEKNRFRNFDNVAELSKMYAEIADVRNDSNLQLPKPKPHINIVTVKQSDAVAEINSAIVDMVQSKNGSYFGIQGDYNTPWGLLASTLSTKAAISPRLIDPDIEDDGGKVSAVCENVKKMYDKFSEQKGTQLIFLDTGIPEKGKKYDAYNDIINRLVEQYGIPREEIVDIHVADNDKKRKELFKKVNEGKVRILIGGTKNMGTGVNVQKRIVAMHHVDVPWTPADREQREGRGVRQGNEIARDFNNNQVEIFFYAMEGSLDMYKYQLQDAKGKMFAQFKTGTVGERNFDEGSSEDEGFNPAEIVALLSGNPVIFEKSKMDKKVEKLRRSKRAYESEWARKKGVYDEVVRRRANMQNLIRLNEQDRRFIERKGFVPGQDGKYPLEITVFDKNVPYSTEKTFTKAKEAGEYIHKLLKEGKQVGLSSFGMSADIALPSEMFGGREVSLNAPSGIKYSTKLSDDATAAGQVMRTLLVKVIDNADVYKSSFDKYDSIVRDANPGEMNFPKQDELDTALKEQKRLNDEYNKLAKKKDNPTESDNNDEVRFRRSDDYTEEEEEIIKSSRKAGKYMKAPNGKRTNLTEKQWLQVRTDTFKKWFGDWENNPSEASKVIDENGEPRVVYHGTPSGGFNVFDNTRKESDSYPVDGYMFATNRKVADGYAISTIRPESGEMEGKAINPEEEDMKVVKQTLYDGSTRYGVQIDGEWVGLSFADSPEEALQNARDVISHRYYRRPGSEVKSAFVNLRNPLVIDNGYWRRIDDYIAEARDKGNDGVIINGIEDYAIDIRSPKDEDNSDIIAFAPNQIKSATDNVGSFSEDSDDIRFRSAESRDNAISRIKDITGAKGYRNNSAYAEGETEDGEKWVIRVSDHPASMTNFEDRNPDARYVLSIVVNDDFDPGRTRQEPITDDERIWQVIMPSDGIDYERLTKGIDRFKRWGDGSYVGSYNTDIDDIMYRAEDKIPADETTTAEVKNAAQMTADRLGVPVEFVDREEMPAGGQNAKGYYSDGKVYVCAENNFSAEDAAMTVLHEAVGHKGMRQLVGPNNMDRFTMKLFENSDEETRREILALADRHGWRIGEAVEEYIAQQAETMDFNNKVKRFFVKVADLLRDMLDRIGIRFSRPLSLADTRWLLWNSYNSLNRDDVFIAARRAVLASRLGYDMRSVNEAYEGESAIRMREGTDAMVLSAARLYNRKMRSSLGMLREVYQDQFRSVEKLVDAISRQSNKPVEDWENVMYALNRLSSINYAEKSAMLSRYFEPMWKTIGDIMDRSGVSFDDVNRYVQVKSGLERNEVFAKRDARNEYRSEYDARIKAINSEYEKAIEASNDIADVAVKNDFLEQAEKTRDNKLKTAEEWFNGKLQDIEDGTDSKYLKNRENDYSGLMAWYSTYDEIEPKDTDESEEEYQARVMRARHAMYDTLAEAEDAATTDTKDFETRIGSENVTRLWDLINGANKATLKHQLESGMISKQLYDILDGMMKYYVPLRGFADSTAEDIYTYFNEKSGTGFANPVMAAKGRKTMAESPFGWMATMMESAIQADNKNKAKMALYYFVTRRPGNDLVSISKTWYEKTGTTDDSGRAEFVEVYPEIKEGMTPYEVSQAVKEFNDKMWEKAKNGEAFQGSKRLRLSSGIVNIEPSDKPEHVINVMIAGEKYSMIVNGNPRAAQAINGFLNRDNSRSSDKAMEKVAAVTRYIAMINTSLNPEFMMRNFMRDMGFAFMGISTKESGDYTARYAKNWAKSFRIFNLISKHKNGVTASGYYEKMYEDFINNGGVTGYTKLVTNVEYEDIMAKFIKRRKFREYAITKALKGTIDGLNTISEGVENISRFAAFLTSREMGRSIEKSVKDAKEVTVNFNTKGSGKSLSWEEVNRLNFSGSPAVQYMQKVLTYIATLPAPFVRSLYVFFNASVQGLANFGRIVKSSPVKASAWIAAAIAVGFLNALMHALMDDDDDYLQIPDYERRTNVMLGSNGYYFKWALPQEAVPFFGMGDILANMMMGKARHKNVPYEIAESFMELLPLNPLTGEGGLREIVPSALQPFWDVYTNQNFLGSPIYRNMPWDEDDPAYKRVFNNTSPTLISISEGLNTITGGDYSKIGWIGNGPWVNPASWEHILESYTGGIGTFFNRLAKTGRMAFTDEEINWRNVPFVNKIFVSNDDRYRDTYVNDVYFYWKDEAEETAKNLREYRKARDNERYGELRRSPEYRRLMIYERYEDRIEKMMDRIKDEADEQEKKRLNAQLDEIKRSMNDAMVNVE